MRMRMRMRMSRRRGGGGGGGGGDEEETTRLKEPSHDTSCYKAVRGARQAGRPLPGAFLQSLDHVLVDEELEDGVRAPVIQFGQRHSLRAQAQSSRDILEDLLLEPNLRLLLARVRSAGGGGERGHRGYQVVCYAADHCDDQEGALVLMD
eukprot:66510-Hanusia_phi.AAC.1